MNFKYFYRLDDPRQKRAILVASKVDNKIFLQPDIIVHRGRIRTFLSHTKKYMQTIIKIITGKVNS